MNPKISIIMPSLNVADYIRECIQSVLAQTLEEIEILCIDAGSTDGTLDILREYVEKDSRVKIFYSEKKSYGYQVNMGIDIARGKYIAIVETDDYVDSEMFQYLWNLAEKNNLDYVKADFDMYCTMKNNQRLYQRIRMFGNQTDKYERLLTNEERETLHEIDYNVWRGIYKKNFLKTYEIRFQETFGAAFQDIGFLQLVICYAKRVMYTDKSFYRYCIDREEASSNKPNGVQYAYQEFSTLFNDKKLLDNISSGHLKGMYYRLSTSFLGELNKVLKYKNFQWETEYIQKYYEWFKEVLFEAIKQKKIVREGYSEEEWIELQLFCKSIQSYSDYMYVIQKIQVEKENKFIEELKKLLKKEGDICVIIFGCGVYGKNVYKLLDKNGIKVEAFCDNDKSVWNTSIGGCKVLSPDECISVYKQTIFIVANKKYAQDMKQQLENEGVLAERIKQFM